MCFISGNTYKKPSERLKNVVKTESLLDKDEKDLTEEEKAAKALLEESKNWQENRDNEEVPNANLVIESSANNGILDEKALFDNDVESRPDVSSQDDYESIPVEGEYNLTKMAKNGQKMVKKWSKNGPKMSEMV